jgi:glycosyltransferase involved in cell wall biosynthesis
MVRSRSILSLLDKCCRAVYHRARRVVALSPGMTKALIARGVPSDRAATIFNWCEEEYFTPSPADPDIVASLRAKGKFIVMFAGTMGKAQGLEFVLAGAEAVRNTLPHVHFVFVGGGIEVPRLQELACARGLTNVTFIPRKPFAEIGRTLGAADVCLVHLRKDPLFEITIPSKIQAYLSMGKPILIGVEGDAADIILSAEAGIPYRPDSTVDFVDALRQISTMEQTERETMGRKGREFYLREMSLERGVSKFEQLFSEVVLERTEDPLGIYT